ncbi:MAG: hypothetical protein M3N53_13745 [Actinomycetota bacterium]|nr:hypothetical protein [Actinomycetota bacterium]
MEANTSTSPTPATSPVKPDPERTLDAVAAGETVLGERLLVVGRGPAGVPGAMGALVAVAEHGELVLVLPMPRVGPEAAATIADRLDELAAVGDSDLQAVSGRPLPRGEVMRRHSEFFEGAEPLEALNREQRVFLLVRDPPSVEAWKALYIELGNMLAGVWELRDGRATPVQPPGEILRKKKSREGASPWATAFGAVVVLAGVALGALAFTRGAAEDTPRAVPDPIVEPPIRDVAFDVPADATHSQWIGQQRLLRTSDGKLVALYPGEEGLQVVLDQRNQGRSWRSPILFPQITPTSLSAAIDPENNLHVAFSDGSSISYARLEATGRGWKAPLVLTLDDASDSPVVDIDFADGLVHVVWAADSPEGQLPRWGVITAIAGDPQIVEIGELTEAGDEIPVLVNVAVGPNRTIHATYRRGDSPLGWFARRGTVLDTGQVAWSPEDRLSSGEGFGAAALAVDRAGVAHLVLRDSTSFQLLYFRRSEQGGWSSPQTAVDATATVEIDFPVLSLDASSRLVYLFFQTSEFNPANEVALAVRDPATGWEGPYRIAPTSEGALYPTAIGVANGQPIALWTKGGATPAIQAARIIAP